MREIIANPTKMKEKNKCLVALYPVFIYYLHALNKSSKLVNQFANMPIYVCKLFD
jgi:hypothetical protein